ncbi:hypothetical protein KRM28CT15_25660 [Krasilnikovia sp. M28-CT-15]
MYPIGVLATRDTNADTDSPRATSVGVRPTMVVRYKALDVSQRPEPVVFAKVMVAKVRGGPVGSRRREITKVSNHRCHGG